MISSFITSLKKITIGETDGSERNGGIVDPEEEEEDQTTEEHDVVIPMVSQYLLL